jgi:hypothetical protein
MGLSTWKSGPGGPIRKADVVVAKNYYNEEELRSLNLIVDQYLSFAELQAQQRKPMHMKDWVRKLHDFLTLNDRNILKDLGKVSHELASELAREEFEKYQQKQRQIESQQPLTDFDQAIKKIEEQKKKKPKEPPETE